MPVYSYYPNNTILCTPKPFICPECFLSFFQEEPKPGRLSMMLNGKRSDCHGSSGSVVVLSITLNLTLTLQLLKSGSIVCPVPLVPGHIIVSFIHLYLPAKLEPLALSSGWMQVAFVREIKFNSTAYRSPSSHRCHEVGPKAAAYNRRAFQEANLVCFLQCKLVFTGGRNTTKPLQSPG